MISNRAEQPAKNPGGMQHVQFESPGVPQVHYVAQPMLVVHGWYATDPMVPLAHYKSTTWPVTPDGTSPNRMSIRLGYDTNVVGSSYPQV